MDGPWDRASGRRAFGTWRRPRRSPPPSGTGLRGAGASLRTSPPIWSRDPPKSRRRCCGAARRQRLQRSWHPQSRAERHTPSARTERAPSSLSPARLLTTPLLPLQVHALGAGRLLFASAALGIVHDTASGAHYYEGHDDDVTAVALHPAGELAATAQIASAWSGRVRGLPFGARPTAPKCAASDGWRTQTPQTRAARTRVPTPPPPRPRGRPGGLPARARAAASAPVRAGTRCMRRRPDPSVLRALDLCASPAALAPRCQPLTPRDPCICRRPRGFAGRLPPVAVGCDDQHTIGVWDWRRGELLISRPGLTARPPGSTNSALRQCGPPTARLARRLE